MPAQPDFERRTCISDKGETGVSPLSGKLRVRTHKTEGEKFVYEEERRSDGIHAGFNEFGICSGRL